MNRLVLIALGTLTMAACDSYPFHEDDAVYFNEDFAPVEGFARGANFEDVSTRYGEVQGFALGTNDFGALGMVGMVCSFGTDDAELRMDVAPDEDAGTVVDARAEFDGFATLAIDGDQITVSVFPDEWNGAVSVDVAPPGGDIDDAAFANDDIVVIRHRDAQCVVERFESGSMNAIASTPLDGPCISGIDTDPMSGMAYVSTDRVTYGIGVDGIATEIGKAATHLAVGQTGTIALAADGTIQAVNKEAQWTTAIGGDISDVSWVSGDRVVASIDINAKTELVLLDGTSGAVLERVTTQGIATQIQSSPQGDMLAIESQLGLHMVRVLDARL